MKKTAFKAGLLVLVCFMLCLSKTASSSDIPNAATYLYSINLKSAASQQFAKATFLPDYNGEDFSNYDSLDDDYNSSNCQEYPHSSCPTGGRCEACPFNARKYKVVACNAPYIKSEATCVCPAATPIIYPNDVCTKYCGNTCIAKTCTPSANKTTCTNGFRDCDNGCGQNTRKCCNSCTNKITTKPENSSYTYSSCTDDDGNKQIQTGWKCNSGYHEKNGECEKDCIANNCSGYPHSNPPSNATYSSCTITATNCSTDGVRYKVDSCNDGYKLSGNSCIAKTCEEKGQKTCNGSCIATSECCGGCSSGYECSNGSCVKKTDGCYATASNLQKKVDSFNDSAKNGIAFCDAGCSNCGYYPMMMDCERQKEKLLQEIAEHNAGCTLNKITDLLWMCPTRGLCRGSGSLSGGNRICNMCMRSSQL